MLPSKGHNQQENFGPPRVNGKEHGNHNRVLGFPRDNGKENGNHYSILGFPRVNGKENGNCYSILGEHGHCSIVIYNWVCFRSYLVLQADQCRMKFAKTPYIRSHFQVQVQVQKKSEVHEMFLSPSLPWRSHVHENHNSRGNIKNNDSIPNWGPEGLP